MSIRPSEGHGLEGDGGTDMVGPRTGSESLLCEALGTRAVGEAFPVKILEVFVEESEILHLKPPYLFFLMVFFWGGGSEWIFFLSSLSPCPPWCMSSYFLLFYFCSYCFSSIDRQTFSLPSPICAH